METNKENYRQWMLGQIQTWDNEIARLRRAIERLDGQAHLEGHRLMWELDKRHRELFSSYEDMMLSGDRDWDALLRLHHSVENGVPGSGRSLH